MFDLPQPIHPSTGVCGVPPGCPSGITVLGYPFALTLSRRAPADLMSGRAAPLVLARFATLAEAMQGAIDHAEGIAPDAAPQCSRPRVEVFGGGAHVIDLGARKSIGWNSSQEWLAAALNGEDADA